jgi:hypothetical protein
MSDAILDFLAKPNPKSFMAAREYVLKHPTYRPYSDELEELDVMIDAEDYEAVLKLAPAALPNLMLSPRLHLMLAYTHRRLGDERKADMESAIARACIEGILMTGRGTREEPWLVLRASDEYDVLMFIDRRMEEQELVHDGNRALDRLVCADGKESWFDITDAYFSPDNPERDA